MVGREVVVTVVVAGVAVAGLNGVGESGGGEAGRSWRGEAGGVRDGEEGDDAARAVLAGWQGWCWVVEGWL